jgi:prevent-host-death family protein
MAKIVGVAEVKRHFSEVIVEVSRDGEQFIIARKGKPMAALVSLEDLESIEKGGGTGKKKGLLAAIGAWDDFEGIEGVVEHIYERRRKAKGRRLRRLS